MVPQGHVYKIITKPHKSCIFLFFAITFKIQKVQKWQTPFWNPHYKEVKYCLLWHFLLQNKKMTNFSCASKQLQVCFPLAAWHSSLQRVRQNAFNKLKIIILHSGTLSFGHFWQYVILSEIISYTSIFLSFHVQTYICCHFIFYLHIL